MSRNLRNKPSTPVASNKSTKTPCTNDTSDDDDYAGVDLVSDSEEDEPDVEVAEEQAIIESEEEEDDGDDEDATPQPENDDDQSSWGGFDLEEDQAEFLGDAPFFDEQMARTSAPDTYIEASAWAVENEASDDESPTETPRRVRFDLSESDSTGSDADENIFPDIFLEQNSLDPGFRRTIENDRNKDNDDPPSDGGSCWDFRADEGDVPGNMNIEDDDDDSDSSFGSSGYETDEGETTEEDLPPAAQYVPARTVLRRQSTESSASEEDITIIRRNPYRTPVRSGPKLASWVTDASKPFAVLDSRGKKLMMFKARINRRFTFNGSSNRPVSRGFIEERDHDVTGMDMSPMISNSANLMMSAMYTPLDNILGGQALGPPEAFYPFVSIASNGNVTQDSPSSSFEEDDGDDDDMWNIGDLIDFGDDTSDEDDVAAEEGNDSSDSTSRANILSSTPTRPTTATSEDQVHPLLNHFDRGVVGAFRRNQTRHQLLSRNVATRESLAFSGPYIAGTLRGIKGGRLAAANAPITPLRRSRPLKADLASSPSHIDAISVAEKKRKFSGEQHSHKRSRSLV